MFDKQERINSIKDFTRFRWAMMKSSNCESIDSIDSKTVILEDVKWVEFLADCDNNSVLVWFLMDVFY